MPTLHEAGKPATNLPFDIQLTDLTTQSLAIPTSSTGPTSITGPTSVMPSDATSYTSINGPTYTTAMHQ